MGLTQDRAALAQLQREIAALRTKEAGEAKKIADAQKNLNKALDSARRASSSGLAKSYSNTAERESRNLETAQSNNSKYATQGAAKVELAAKLQDRIAKEEEKERKAASAADEKRRRDDNTRRQNEEQQLKRARDAEEAMQARIRDLERQLAAQLEAQASATPAFKPSAPKGQTEVYDVFISHAWNDKEEFVDELVEKAKSAGLRVWYDTDDIGWGQSLRQRIDAGLAGSYFGIAVLSPSFFAKEWPQYELDGIMEKATSGTGRLLPIWHKLSKDEVAKHAPSLAGRLALNTSLLSADEIVAELKKLRDQYRGNAEDAGRDA